LCKEFDTDRRPWNERVLGRGSKKIFEGGRVMKAKTVKVSVPAETYAEIEAQLKKDVKKQLTTLERQVKNKEATINRLKNKINELQGNQREVVEKAHKIVQAFSQLTALQELAEEWLGKKYKLEENNEEDYW